MLDPCHPGIPMTDIDTVMRAIEHVLDDLDGIGRTGLTIYQRYPAEFRIEHDARAKASNIYCHMLAEAERRFDGVGGVVLKDVRGLKVFLIGDAAVIRFKRMDEEGRSRSYPTKQAKDYDKGIALPGLPAPAVRLTVGYLPDATETGVVRVQVAHPKGKEIDWCAAIVPAEERAGDDARWFDVTRQGRLAA